MITAPSSASIAETVLLPDAIPPVSPTRVVTPRVSQRPENRPWATCEDHPVSALRPGDRVALLVPGSPRYVDVVLSLLVRGIIPIPLDPRLT